MYNISTMPKGIKLTPSLENYLEAILALEKKYRVARVKDIAKRLGVQMPSVTGALKNLKAKELINYEKNSFISLTKKGLAVANSVQNRHSILAAFLEKILLVPRDQAQNEACKIEHTISPDTACRIQNLTSYIDENLFTGQSVNPKEWETIVTGGLSE